MARRPPLLARRTKTWPEGGGQKGRGQNVRHSWNSSRIDEEVRELEDLIVTNNLNVINIDKDI